MLFKFKSKAAADLIMLEADARRLLTIMLGNDPDKGVMQAHDLPEALSRLQAVVAQDEALRQAHRAQAAAHKASPEAGQAPADNSVPVPVQPEWPSVRLAQRAAPMVHTLQRNIAEATDIVWGV